MIVAIGLDIVDLARIKAVWQRHPERFLERHFAPEEIAYCRDQADPVPSLGGRFAAKEAFQKCWHQTHGWRDVWVARDGAKPQLDFSARIRQELEERGWVAHVSLSHSKGYAVAVVIVEKGEVEKGEVEKGEVE